MWSHRVGHDWSDLAAAAAAAEHMRISRVFEYSITCGAQWQKRSQNVCSSFLKEVFPGGSDGKEAACNEGGLGSVPGSGRSPEEGNVYPLQFSCLENPMDRGAWWNIVRGVAKSQTRLSNSHFLNRGLMNHIPHHWEMQYGLSYNQLPGKASPCSP